MYSFRTTHGPVELAFTDRYDGVSAVPFDSLDLALEGDDDPADVSRNLELLLADFAPSGRLADMRQVHGADVAEADPGSARPACDGLVTDRAGVVLMVRAADCVPVLLADGAAGVLGAAHAGRPGVRAGVVTATVDRMRQLGAREVTGWIGPHVCGACYEVPEQMQAEVAAAEPATLSRTSWGTPSLDLGAGVRAQLERTGVTVVDASRCTRESADLFSYRRDGRDAGRMAGLVVLKGSLP